MRKSTGQKDRKGNDIFEGDIVQSWNIDDANGNPAICEVFWRESG